MNTVNKFALLKAARISNFGKPKKMIQRYFSLTADGIAKSI
jgi:hypothetical protein